MNIMLIDDDHTVLSTFAAMLRTLRHEVSVFPNAAPAMEELTWDTDLVISDVEMPGLDGFDVAQRVAALCGSSPPRTLLISGGDHEQRLRQCTPTAIIGLLYKPFRFADVRRVLAAIEEIRTKCPGTMSTFRMHGIWKGMPECPGAEVGPLCQTPQYASCPHYDTCCGRAFRTWVQMACPDTGELRHAS